MKQHSDKDSIHILDEDIAKYRRGDKIGITIIGAGGTGSHLAYSLASAYSVHQKMNGRLIHVDVFDPDTVERHNIGKQAYFDPDRTRNKAEMLVTRINRTYGLDWSSYPHKWKPNNLRSQIIITCVDSWATRKYISKNKSAYYWMDIGNGQNDGQIILWAKNDSRMISVIDHSNGGKVSTQDESISCSMVQSLSKQGIFINKIIATLAANMLYTLLFKGEIDYRGIIINLDQCRILPIKF